MKKTIREEKERETLITCYIGANSFLIYSEYENDPNKISMSVQYIKGETIREDYITILSKEQFENKRRDLIEFNTEGTAVAAYIEKDGNYILDCIYDFETHSKYCGEFLYLTYQEKFGEDNINPQLVKRRKRSDLSEH